MLRYANASCACLTGKAGGVFRIARVRDLPRWIPAGIVVANRYVCVCVCVCVERGLAGSVLNADAVRLCFRVILWDEVCIRRWKGRSINTNFL